MTELLGKVIVVIFMSLKSQLLTLLLTLVHSCLMNCQKMRTVANFRPLYTP